MLHLILSIYLIKKNKIQDTEKTETIRNTGFPFWCRLEPNCSSPGHLEQWKYGCIEKLVKEGSEGQHAYTVWNKEEHIWCLLSMHILLKSNLKSLPAPFNVSLGGYFELEATLKRSSGRSSHLLCRELIISLHCPACIGSSFSTALVKGNYFPQSSSA